MMYLYLGFDRIPNRVDFYRLINVKVDHSTDQGDVVTVTVDGPRKFSVSMAPGQGDKCAEKIKAMAEESKVREKERGRYW